MVHFRRSSDVPEVSITISLQTFVRTALLVVVTILLLEGLHKAAHAILLIVVAVFFALALNAPVYWLSRKLPGKRRGSRALATVISILVVVLILGAFVASIAPPLVRQTNNFVHAAPRLVRDFRSQDSETGRFIRRYHLEKQVDTISDQLSQRLKNLGGTAFSTVNRIGSSFFSVLTIMVLTFMMLIEGPHWVRLAEDIVPDEHHPMAKRIAHDCYRVIKGFVNGQVILAVLASLLIVPMLFILGISYAVALMLVVFICGLIPLVGHTIGAIIITIVALFHSTSAAVIILAYYILYQQIENYLIQPRIQANSTNMSPLLVFMCVIIGVSFGGLVGGLLAIPVGGCLRVIALEYMRSRNIIGPATLSKEISAETK